MGIVRRAQGATTKAIPVWIVEEEQRSDRPQDPCALRVAAARGHLRCWRPSTMHFDIACGPPPSIWPRGARNAALCTFTTDSWSPHGGLPSRDGIILRLRAAFHRFNAPASAGTILRSRKSRKEPTAAPIGVL